MGAGGHNAAESYTKQPRYGLERDAPKNTVSARAVTMRGAERPVRPIDADLEFSFPRRWTKLFLQ